METKIKNLYFSDKELTDGEHPPKFLPIIPRGKIGDKENKQNLTSIPEGSVSSPKGTPTKMLPTQSNIESNLPTPQSVASPRHFPFKPEPTSEVLSEQWIDGPKVQEETVMKSQKRPAELWVDGPTVPVLMDPGKRKMVAQWVTLQKQEMAAQQFALNYQKQNGREIWIDQGPKCEEFPPHYYHPVTFSPSKEPGGPRELHVVDYAKPPESMETSSEAVETADVSVQIDESEIDLETGNDQAIWPTTIATDADIRILEDIAEVEEETCSSEGRSLRNGATNTDSLELRNEGLTTFVDSDTFSRSSRVLKSFKHSSLQPDDHPLRILSREHMDAAKSDTVSFTTDNLDALSLPDTAELNDEELLMTEEDLEKAMRASMTSIRSHEVLERLRTDKSWRAESPPLPASMEKRVYDQNGNSNGQKRIAACDQMVIPQLKVTDTHCRLIASETDSESPHPSLRKPIDCNQQTSQDCPQFERWCPEGASSSDVEKDSEAFGVKSLQCPSRIAVVKKRTSGQATKPLSASMRESDRIVLGHSGDLSDSSKSEKLHIPTIPTLSKSVAKEVVQKLTDGNAAAAKTAGLKSPQKSTIPTPKGIAPMKLKSQMPPTTATMTCSVVVDKTNKIPPVELNSKSSNSASFFGFKSANNSSTAKSSVKLGKTVVKVPSDTGKPVEKSSGKTATTNGRSTGKSALITTSQSSETDKKDMSSSTTKSKSLKSPLMSFLRSPTKSSKLLPSGGKEISAASTSHRVSSGYDSGHDSGIVSGEKTNPADLISPYQKVTKPRTSQRSSSGHGSDNR